jgi:hypothetical protein
MGQTIDIKAISTSHYNTGLELAKSAVKELYGVQEFNMMEFNFKVKNLFVMPGNVTRGIFVDDHMVGFVICSQNEMLWNDQKKLSIDFFYITAEHRSTDNISKIYAYIEDYAFTNGYDSIRFDDSLPYFSDHVKSFDQTKQISTIYEREVI